MAEEKKAEKKTEKTKRPSAKKRDLQNERRNLSNRSFKSRVSTAIRTFEKELTGNREAAKSHLNTLYSLLDKGAKKHVFSFNKVGRLKAKFAARLSS